jgi:large subunit ribosomal protein L17
MARKLSLQRDQRRSLIRGLVNSLVLHESITTTEAKAKEIAPVFERLVTKAKAGTLHAQRQVRTVLLTENAAQKLFQELTPAFAERNGGYTRIIKIGNRRGDNAPMAIVSLVLPEKKADKPVAAASEAPAKAEEAKTKPKTAAKKPAAKKPAVKTASAK